MSLIFYFLLFFIIGVAGKKKTYDLNTQTDPFFGRYAGSPFPDAVNANEKELAEVKEEMNICCYGCCGDIECYSAGFLYSIFFMFC